VKLKSLFSVILVTSSIASISSLGTCHPSFASNSHKLVRPEPAIKALIVSELISAKEYLARGNTKYKSQDYRGAIADYTEAILLNGAFTAAYNNRGNAKEKLQDYPGAIADYDLAIGLERQYTLAYYNRGNAKAKLQDYPGAISDYNQAVLLDPKYIKAYNNRGSTKQELKDYQGAITDYTQAISLDLKYINAYYGRGNTKYKAKDYQGAITDYEQVIALNPNYLNVADNLRKAKNTADRANVPTPNPSSPTPQKTAQYYEQQGAAKFKVKDYQGAMIEFDRAIEIDPQSASSYEGRGTAKYLLKQSKAALPDLERAADLFSQQNNDNRYQGVMSGIRQIKSEQSAQMGADKYIRGDHQGAIADCDRAIDINPKNADAYEIRGAAKYALKQRENAIRDLERAADLYRQLNNDQKYKEMVSLIGQFKAAR
jgi:tetratricopeptide (TPR) repeat protein